MNRYLIFILILCASIANGAVLNVTDTEDGSVLEGVTVFSDNGVIVGYTDSNGNIELGDNVGYPLFVRCTGYVQVEISAPVGAIALTHIEYRLPELNVEPSQRPVERTLCYARQYASVVVGTDTLISYNEMLLEFFSSRNKVKGFNPPKEPKLLASKFYVREVDSEIGLDSVYVIDERPVYIDWDALLSMPDKLPQKKGKEFEVVQGKYGIYSQTRRTPSRIYTQIDFLSDYKNHKFSPFILKMLGMAMEITEMKQNYAYSSEAEDDLPIDALISETLSMKLTGKGKLFKKAIGADSEINIHVVYELYPLETEHLTVAEAKDLLKKKNRAVAMRRSPNAPRLSPAVRKMVDQADAKNR